MSIKIGLLSFSDGRERVHRDLTPHIEEIENKLTDTLRSLGIEYVKGREIIHSNETAVSVAKDLAKDDLDGVILNISVFAFPNFILTALNFIDRPILIYSFPNGKFPGLGGLLAVSNALKRVGINHEKLWGDLEENRVKRKILTFAKAAHAKSRLKGQTFGIIGGRSIGITIGTLDPEDWYKKFGIDVEHIDQLEIIRRAGLIPSEKVENAFNWISHNVKNIYYDNNKLTEESLKFQIRCYYALKDIKEEYKLDFAGIKCHYELSEYYVTQCLSACFFNDPYDWDGLKEPFVLSCEADAEGALTMQILKLITGLPVLFMDVRHYKQDENIFIFSNCGAQASWYSARELDPIKNVKNIELCPLIPKYAGKGAHIRYVAKSGEITLARLAKDSSGYTMIATKALFKDFPVEKTEETCSSWPHAYAQIDVDPYKFIEALNSNHIHGVYGDYIEELKDFCQMIDIKFLTF